MDEHRDHDRSQGDDAPGLPSGAHHPDAARAEARARVRLEALFEGLDRLTPDELARIGLRRDHGAARRSQLELVEAAARSAGRSRLLEEARAAARDAVMQRFSGDLDPTWSGVGWGMSQGRAEDRAAIVEALEDAASVAVVWDLVDPEVADALSLDAEHLVGMSTGDASDVALARIIAPPLPGYSDTRTRRIAVGVGALLVGLLAIGAGAFAAALGAAGEVTIGAGAAAGVVAAGIVFALARR
jgi:hypothetical protein